MITENDKSNEASSCNFENCDNVKTEEDSSKKECRSLRSVTKSGKYTRTRRSVNTFDKNVKKDSDKKKRTEACSKKVSSDEDKLLNLESKEKSIKTKKANAATVASTNVTEQNNTQNSVVLSQNSVVLIHEDDNNSSMSDKMEHPETSDTSTADSLRDNKNVNNSLILEQKSISSPVDNKIDTTNRLPTKSKNLLFGSEEHSRDSEMDGKMDSEDAKVSSSSENSNDTLLSSNSCKVSDLNVDNKNTLNQMNEADKKPGFRSRSGSTDTTGSESGSNSSGVRRSNRIRTIGLMKQRYVFI